MNGAAMYSSIQAGGTDDQVLQHAPLVKRIAYHLKLRLPENIVIDDLIQAGMIGLLEAIKNYDMSQGASFDTYAGIRIRGAMLDEVRRADWTPRSVHKKSRMVSEAIREVENRLGHDARESDVAEHMGISVDEYNHILQDTIACKTFDIDDVHKKGEDFPKPVRQSEEQPIDNLAAENFQRALADAIRGLPEREKLVVSLYYDEELNLREIGKVLDVSESRVSQICSQAMLRLRSRLADWQGIQRDE